MSYQGDNVSKINLNTDLSHADAVHRPPAQAGLVVVFG